MIASNAAAAIVSVCAGAVVGGFILFFVTILSSTSRSRAGGERASARSKDMGEVADLGRRRSLLSVASVCGLVLAVLGSLAAAHASGWVRINYGLLVISTLTVPALMGCVNLLVALGDAVSEGVQNVPGLRVRRRM